MIKQLTILLLLFATVVLSACNKDDKPLPVEEREIKLSTRGGVPSMEVGISYHPDTALLSIRSEGTEELITLSLENLPPGVTGGFIPASGKGDFDSQLWIAADSNAYPGVYEFITKASTADGLTRELNSVLTVWPFCGGDMAGIYTGTDMCNHSSGPAAYAAPILFGLENIGDSRILIANFAGSGDTLFADIECSNRTVNIPTQTLQQGTQYFTVRGYGNYTPPHYIIHIHH